MSNIGKWGQQTMTAVAMIVCLVLLRACSPTGPRRTPFPTLAPSPTPVQLPAFLSYTWPRPGAIELQGLFSHSGPRSAWATLELDEIAEPGERLTLDELQERVEFLLDDQPVDAEIVEGIKPRQVQILGRFGLDLGEHTATVRVRRMSGERLEFSWTFTVVAEEPTMPGLPEGLQFVRPLPDSTITQQAYREEHLVPGYYAPGFADLRGGVCFGVLPGKIVQPGEFLDGPTTSSKYAFVALDGAPSGPDAMIGKGYEPYQVRVFGETHRQIIASYVGPHHYSCWQVDLAPDEHQATIQLQQTPEEVIEFTWWFTITND